LYPDSGGGQKYFTNLIPLFGKDNIEAVTISVFIFILRFSKKLQKSAHPSSFILKLLFISPGLAWPDGSRKFSSFLF